MSKIMSMPRPQLQDKLNIVCKMMLGVKDDAEMILVHTWKLWWLQHLFFCGGFSASQIFFWRLFG